MQQSVKELLYSLPIEIEFAGLRGTTVSLAKAGWDISIREFTNHYNRGHELQLVLRHGDKNNALYMVTSPILVTYGEWRRHQQDPIAYAEFFSHRRFYVQHCAPDIQFRIIPTQGFSMKAQFQPMDAYPSERHETESIRDFKFFKTIEPQTNKDLIVLPEQVPELLNAILKAQSASQEEIKKRVESRRNLSSYKDGSMFRPAHEVEAQVLTLAV